EVAPVHADVAERAGGAAQARVDPPVAVLRPGQPVLQIAAVQQVQGAAARDAGAGFPHGGIEAVDEGYGGHESGRGGQVGQVPCAGEVGREGLLADHVLAGGQRALDERDVQVVGGADVDEVDVVGGQQFL